MAITTTKTINWGGVLKGVAIVTAVVAVAVVASWGVGAIAGSETVANFFAESTVHSLVTSTANGLSTAWDWLGTQAAWLAGEAKDLWAALPDKLGLSSSLSTAASANIAAATGGVSGAKIAATLGGTVATVAAASAALPTLSHIDYTHTTSVDTHTVAAHQANMMGMHEAAHTAQHIAADHTSESQQRRWADRMPQRQTDFSSFAAAARANKPAASVATPKDSFAEQLNADSANLSQALGK